MTREYLERVKKELGTEIREKIKAGIDISESECLDIGLKFLKRIYAGEPVNQSFSRRFFTWSSYDLDNVTKIWKEIKPEIEEFIPICIKKNKGNRMVREINQVTADALIRKAMNEAGLRYLFIPQAYRAKIAVKLNDKSKVIFYISYKKLNDELPKAIENIKSIIDHMNLLGNGASIQKIMRFEVW